MERFQLLCLLFVGAVFSSAVAQDIRPVGELKKVGPIDPVKTDLLEPGAQQGSRRATADKYVVFYKDKETDAAWKNTGLLSEKAARKFAKDFNSLEQSRIALPKPVDELHWKQDQQYVIRQKAEELDKRTWKWVNKDWVDDPFASTSPVKKQKNPSDKAVPSSPARTVEEKPFDPVGVWGRVEIRNGKEIVFASGLNFRADKTVGDTVPGNGVVRWEMEGNQIVETYSDGGKHRLDIIGPNRLRSKNWMTDGRPREFVRKSNP